MFLSLYYGLSLNIFASKSDFETLNKNVLWLRDKCKYSIHLLVPIVFFFGSQCLGIHPLFGSEQWKSLAG